MAPVCQVWLLAICLCVEYLTAFVGTAKEQIRAIRAKLGDTIEIIAGNIASYDSAMFLLEDEKGARPDALKVNSPAIDGAA